MLKNEKNCQESNFNVFIQNYIMPNLHLIIRIMFSYLFFNYHSINYEYKKYVTPNKYSSSLITM